MAMIPIASIRKDGGTQPRSFLNSEVIEEYAEAMQAGAKFPPIDVFYDGTTYWLADGFHRVEAAFGAERDEIDANVHQGTVQDAQWFSFGANKANGLYRSNADKQRAIKSALLHPKSVGMSDRDIARHVGVGKTSVLNWRESLSGQVDQMNFKPTSRTATRNGKEYQINVSNIGKRETKPSSGHTEASSRDTSCPPDPTQNAAYQQDRPVQKQPEPKQEPQRPKESTPVEPSLEAQWADWLVGILREISNCPVDAKSLASELNIRHSGAWPVMEQVSDFLTFLAEQGKRKTPAA